MEEPKMIINTIMTKNDYRKFLYIATFKRNKFTIPMLALIALLGSLIVSFDNENFNWIKLIISWALLFALAIIAVLIKVERRNAQRIKTDKTGAFDSVNTLKFYDDRIVMENEALKSKGELRYDQFYAVMESKDYFIFYLTANQASLIRKKDVDNLNDFKEFIVGKFQGRYKSI
ncbi:YcxB family protein [Clostridium thermosuccinogenes]|uniref:YcxB family protein n=1 Tax=Clostridium thermosuccinogenes TaxID=84032 RepID=UPI001FA84996|nr:YcxB family protein [Pseudoclostridium thermosuccinogenes]